MTPEEDMKRIIDDARQEEYIKIMEEMEIPIYDYG